MTTACHRGFATAVALASLATAGFGFGLLLPWIESRIFRKKMRIGRGSVRYVHIFMCSDNDCATGVFLASSPAI